MAEKNILLEALDARWRRLGKDWDRTRRKYSDDAVHDLRVSSRRLIAVLDTLRSLVDDPDIEECRRRVKKSLGVLSPLRDAQVQRNYVSQMANDFSQLKSFQKNLKDRETRLAKKVQKHLKKGLRLGAEMTKVKKRSRDQAEDTAVIDVVNKRFDEVLDLAQHVDPADTSTIHQMRLAFKRFRYTAEVVRQLIHDDMTEARLEQLHEFQSMMGHVQDVEVLSARLLKWASKDETRLAEMAPVLEELARRKQNAIETFMASIDQLHTFWKVRHEPLHPETRHRGTAGDPRV
jgi:CHAD domain-containing protein